MIRISDDPRLQTPRGLRAPARRAPAPARRFRARRLVVGVYAELLSFASERARTLPAASAYDGPALLHEAYSRVDAGRALFEGPAHLFFAIVAAIEEVVSEERYLALSTESGMGRRVDLACCESTPAPVTPIEQAVEVDEVLLALRRRSPVDARVVSLRFHLGLTTEETAAIMEVSVATVERRWRRIKDWLRTKLV